MTDNSYDAIIIGAGLAGLTIAALAARDGKNILILESEHYIGGRILSFTVSNGKILLHGRELGIKEFKRTMSSVFAWVTRAEPDLETMLAEGLLDGYSFEAGGHATFWGTKGRVACVLDYLNASVDLPGNLGFTVLDPEQIKLFPVERGGNYDWMSVESNRTGKTLLREMLTASEETLLEWDKISFHQWLVDRTDDIKVYEYLAAVASIHMVMGEPKMIPAGDFIRFMHTAGKIGMNLISGSTGIVPKPGFVKIGEVMGEKIRQDGGTIMTGAKVTEIVFEGDAVCGVKAQTAEGEVSYLSDKVVCTVPIHKIWSFLPEKHFEPGLVRKIKEDFFSVGMLTGFVGVKNNVFVDAGMPAKSWLLAPAIIKAEEGFIGDVDIISIMPSNFEPSLAPNDKFTLGYSIALTDQELRNKAKVDRVIDTARDLFHQTFPTLKENTSWEMWTCSDKGFGDWPPTGEPRPDVTQPGLNGVYFAGDGYGAKTWGSGMDAAVYSGLLCMDTMFDSNYVETILPEYHR